MKLARALITALALLIPGTFVAAEETGYGPPISVATTAPPAKTKTLPPPNWIDQSRDEARRKSAGCLECHVGLDAHTMHTSPNVVLGCTDCHGGNATPGLTLRKAHVTPRHPELWPGSANPNNSSVILNHESPEFIQFVNPGDLRVAEKACGLCHQKEIRDVSHSMMRHGAMLWGAALYNNGGFPHKNYRYGQAYAEDGTALRLINRLISTNSNGEIVNPITPKMTLEYGILPYIDPLPRFVIGQPSNILRIFERGGEKPLELGIPNIFEPPGRPLRRLSDRGLGTLNRIDPVYLNLQKTRLHDPVLDFMGSNNHPGDYRSSGCTACHVIYANDRSPSNSGWYSKYGHQGLSFSGDQAIRKDERGHPIKHEFTRSIPSSQCMNCHMHQGNLFVNPFLGYTWWDQESDAKFMYPNPRNPLADAPHFRGTKERSAFTEQKNPTDEEMVENIVKNPEAAAARGLWGDLDFLEKVAELNPKLKETQFADYHGHGWVFRAVFKKDREGNLRDIDDQLIPQDDEHKFAKAVHLKDIHLAKGMQCVDCHFKVDAHGDGMLYGEPRAATSIECIDCHGTVNERPTLRASGNGGKYLTNDRGVDLAATSTPWGPRFVWEGAKLVQQSSMSPDMRWEIPQTIDVVNPRHPKYNEKARYAKTLRRDGETWGDVPAKNECPEALAHDNGNISCQICHSSWATSCFGCHLPMKANQRTALNKFEGMTTRNFTSYNPQVVRDDVFQLGIDATYKSNRVAVLRSSSAVVVGSQNQNREWIYSQQQTVSAEGYSGQAYNPHFPHTTSGRGTTKNCTECHLSKANDNNAWLTSLLGFGTGTVNFFGRFAWVGAGKDGLHGVAWTEREEPQAAIGSHLHKIAYPDNYLKHLEKTEQLDEAYHHPAEEILDLTLRGEYLYTANGPGGFRVFDVANIDQKGFSERIVTAPVSPLGQRTYLKTKYATSVTLPSTLGIDPLRSRMTNDHDHPDFGKIGNDNQEQPISLIYAWVFITDREEGLVMNTVGTLVDGDPSNNFLDKEKVIRFNPDNRLKGAMHSYMAGTNLFLVADKGLFVLGLSNTELTAPTINAELTTGEFTQPRAVGVQFRYAFVTDAEGFKIVDISTPTKPRAIPSATIPLKNAGRFYLARNFACVANGPEGLAIIDITNPEKPRLHEMFNADGQLNDTRAVQIGSVNASMYALVADGRNGLRVLQMISPANVPNYMGFQPAPKPTLIATYPTHEPAVAVSRGLDRDRVVDETGNQTVVFGRRGSRPFNQSEVAKFLRHESTPGSGTHDGPLFFVEDLKGPGRRINQAVAKPRDFPSEEEPSLIAPANDRLVRRGRLNP
ncbi:MAG: hypothetical protein ISQ14_00080 [Verrucomicrobiae bacterium]|nr:hypothetical protein [Verrucomicrobiae bacterium]